MLGSGLVLGRGSYCFLHISFGTSTSGLLMDWFITVLYDNSSGFISLLIFFSPYIFLEKAPLADHPLS